MTQRNRLLLRLALAAAIVAQLLFIGQACRSAGGRAGSGGLADHQVLLDAIRLVESGGRDDCPDGDDGAAIGPFQIHHVYWRDAVEADPDLGPAAGFDYQDCRQRDYAELVVEAYMKRFVPAAWDRIDAEVIARTHNGGPQGATKVATEEYWRRVQRELAALR